MDMAKFSVRAEISGGKLSINDQSVAFADLQLNVSAGSITTLHVTLPAEGGTVEGEGIVNLYHPSTGDSLLSALDRISSSGIDDEAMNRMGMADNRTLTEIILEILKEKIREAQAGPNQAHPVVSDGG